MFRRVLAMVLAGLLVVESAPVTSYATTLSIETVSENSETAVSENVGSMDGIDENEEEFITDVEETTEVEEDGKEEIEEVVTEDTEEIEPIEYNDSTSDVSVNTLDVDVSSNILNVEAYDDENDKTVGTWYSLTVPKAGYYGLDMTNLGSSEAWVYVYHSLDREGLNFSEYINAYEGADGSIFIAEELAESETIYIYTYTYSSSSTTLDMQIKYYPIWIFEKQEDEFYTVSANEIQLTVAPEIKHETIRTDVSVNALEEDSTDSYYIEAYCFSDSYISSVGQYYHSHVRRNTIPISGLNMGTEYDLFYVVNNSTTEKVIGVFKYDKKFTTPQTEEKIVIYNTSSKENEIQIEYESFCGCYIYYAPTDGSVAEKNGYYSRGWKTVTLSGLYESTEYKIRFENSDTGEVLYQTTITTATNDVVVDYQITVSDNFEQLTFNADVSNYSGTSTSAYLCYEYVDALGIKRTDSLYEYIGSLTADENGKKSFSFNEVVSNPALYADTTYDIKVWLNFNEANYLKRQTISLTTPSAMVTEDDISFSVASNETTNGQADLTVQLANMTDRVAMSIHYKQQGNEAGYTLYTHGMIWNTEENTYSISGLEAGAVYEFVFFAGGISKEVSATIGTATLKLTQVGEGEVNAFDIVRTFKLESTEELTGSYYLRMYYLNNNGSYSSWGNSYELNQENGYECTYKTADYSMLTANREYKLKWTLSTSSYSYSTPEVNVYETVQTRKPGVTFVPGEANYNSQQYTVTLDVADIANFENPPYVYVYAYIRKEGETSYSRNDYISLSENNAYSKTMSLYGLEPETNYEVSMRDDNGNEIENLTFTTSADNRRIRINTIRPSFHSAVVELTVGEYGTEDGYVHAFIRKKGTEDEWEHVSDYMNYWGGYNTDSIYITTYRGVELEEDVTYELTLGLTTSGSVDSIDDLAKVLSTEFTTKKDVRNVTGKVTVGYATANIQANFSGNDSKIGSYIHYFYKVKDADEWIHYDYNYTSSAFGIYSMTVDELVAGTTYDYAIVISDLYSCNGPEEVTNEVRKVVGEFTTKSNTYTLDFAVNDSKTTSDKAIVEVTAKGNAGDSRLDVTLTLSDGQEQTVTLRQSTGYTKNVTFRDLMGSTEYTITKATFRVEENGYNVAIGEIACDYKFTTKEAEVPTAITPVQDKISLNAIYSGLDVYEYDLEGFAYQTIKAEVIPATAAADFVYSSSDENIATVDSNGVVCAVSPGTAVITIASAYDASIKTTCTVEVKKYRVGYTDETGVVNFTGIVNTHRINKGASFSGYGLYEMKDDGTGTLIPDFNVSVERTSVASWVDGKLHALNVGTTDVIFEKDGVKAQFIMSVYLPAKGFGITGFETSNDSYPVIVNADGSYTMVNLVGVTYKALGEIAPEGHNFNPSYFTWQVSDETVATVDAMGVITPVADGTVTLTVTPNNYDYVQDKVEVVLNIKGLPLQGSYETIYALTNTSSKIGDVTFPESWGEGWSWKFPNTPLITNGVYSNNSYQFEAVYNGNNGYPIETELLVYIGKITGAYAGEVYGNHNHVLEVNDTDSIRLMVAPTVQGYVKNSASTVEIPEVSGLTITKADDFYTITAQKAGKYTVQPVIKIGNEVVATTKYTINAVEEKQVADIQIISDTEGVTIEGNKVIFDTVENKKDFALKAVVKDRQGEEIATALQWKTSDKKVAAVTADKNNTHNAKVVTKEAGHATVVVKAKDVTGYQVELDVEVQDHSPRVNTNKATVNIAYNYDNYEGRDLASSAGLVEIVPVYGEFISNITVMDKNGENVEPNLELVSYGSYTYLVKPTQAIIPTGKYSCTLRVTTNIGKDYDYPFTVTVTEKKPKVTAKKCSTVNLFFTETTGTLNLKVTNNARLGGYSWVDKSEGVDNGFEAYGHYYTSGGKYVNSISFEQEDGLKVVNGILQDPGVAEGTLIVSLVGYRESYTLDNIKVNYTYKKPVIVTSSSSSNIIPSIGQRRSDFWIYDKTNWRYLYYNYSNLIYAFEEISCEDDDVILMTNKGSSRVDYEYTGKETQKKIILDLDSSGWREALQTTHTIKTIKPKAYLGTKQFTYNNYAKTSLSSTIYLSGTTNIDNYADVVIKGANPKSQSLLDENLFVATFSESGIITFKQSEASMMNSKIPAGSYSYKVTPYVKNVETGENIALNTLTLKIKVVDKPVTAKISPKGTIDLANGSQYSTSLNKNVVYVEPKFSNMVSGYSIQSAKLVGEYSDYFYFYQRTANDYIRIQSSAVGKLKAGQTYKLAIEYTIRTTEGENFKVTSNTFNIKPKQSKPKVTIGNNNQTLYAAADNVSRTYYLYVPSYYSIESAYGSIDCNKDGKADITVSNSGGSYTTVRIVDRDAVIATTKGKSYSIPVTVRVTGRDGIAKDASVKIKVKVKR